MVAFIKFKHGFTLIEILLALTIAGIISAAIYNTYFGGWEVWAFNQDKINLQQVHRIILNRITPFIREAVGVDTSIPGKLRIKFIPQPGQKYNFLEYGLKNYRFYYRKGNNIEQEKIDWGNRMTITDADIIKIIDPFFNYDKKQKLLKISLTLIDPDNNLNPYTFTDSIYLRNSEINVTP